MSIHVVVMGVAGCGKSTVAEAIHERLGYAYAEGDDFHPQANIDKIHLSGTQELIQQRLNERKGHFMPPALLPSQFAILEPLSPDENGVEVSIEGSVDAMVERALDAVNEYARSVAPQSRQQAA